jgi:hypothetical protein
MHHVKRSREFVRRDRLSAHSNAFGRLDQVGRDVEAGAQPRLAQDALDQGACGALAIGARDVDKTRCFLRPAQGVEQRANALQAKF